MSQSLCTFPRPTTRLSPPWPMCLLDSVRACAARRTARPPPPNSRTAARPRHVSRRSRFHSFGHSTPASRVTPDHIIVVVRESSPSCFYLQRLPRALGCLSPGRGTRSARAWPLSNGWPTLPALRPPQLERLDHKRAAPSASRSALPEQDGEVDVVAHPVQRGGALDAHGVHLVAQRLAGPHERVPLAQDVHDVRLAQEGHHLLVVGRGDVHHGGLRVPRHGHGGVAGGRARWRGRRLECLKKLIKLEKFQ